MKNSKAPESLVKYEPSVEIYDSMKSYHQEKYKGEVAENVTPKN